MSEKSVILDGEPWVAKPFYYHMQAVIILKENDTDNITIFINF